MCWLQASIIISTKLCVSWPGSDTKHAFLTVSMTLLHMKAVIMPVVAVHELRREILEPLSLNQSKLGTCPGVCNRERTY